MQPPDVTWSLAGDDQVAPETRAMLAQGADLYQQATEYGLTLRFLGSLAVQLTCPRWRSLAGALGRRPSQDIDLVGLSREERRAGQYFAEAGYSLHPAVKHSREFGVKRLIFLPGSGGAKVDIFLDDLVMAHTVPLQGRLPEGGPTVAVVDLLLSKLQIHEMTRNDQIDLCILLAEHEPASRGGQLDDRYLAELLGRDWGFWYSAIGNLEGLVAALPGFAGLPADAAGLIGDRATALVQLLRDSPKSAKWRMRSRVGTKVRWYEDVQEVT
jgi:hypothetical protein